MIRMKPLRHQNRSKADRRMYACGAHCDCITFEFACTGASNPASVEVKVNSRILASQCSQAGGSGLFLKDRLEYLKTKN
jgi:hypothetical protein